MAQWSGPISRGTEAERQLTDVLWRNMFGAEAGIVGDLNGSSYAISLPPDSDVAQIGSTTQDSICVVAGFANIIDAGTSVGITIPAATAERTDLIVARYSPDTVGLPGPVQLTRIAGTSSGLPSYDDEPPGVEDMPLWAITRKPNEALSQATVRDLRRRVSGSWTLPPDAPLTLSAPLDSIVRRGDFSYLRRMGSVGVPEWTLTGIPNFTDIGERDALLPAPTLGRMCTVNGLLQVYNTSGWHWENRGIVGSQQTNSLGFLSVVHGLGQTPGGVLVTPGKQASDLLDRVLSLSVVERKADNFVVYAKRNDTNAPLALNDIQFSWTAFV